MEMEMKNETEMERDMAAELEVATCTDSRAGSCPGRQSGSQARALCTQPSWACHFGMCRRASLDLLIELVSGGFTAFLGGRLLLHGHQRERGVSHSHMHLHCLHMLTPHTTHPLSHAYTCLFPGVLPTHVRSHAAQGFGSQERSTWVL